MCHSFLGLQEARSNVFLIDCAQRNNTVLVCGAYSLFAQEKTQHDFLKKKRSAAEITESVFQENWGCCGNIKTECESLLTKVLKQFIYLILPNTFGFNALINFKKHFFFGRNC